MITSFEQANTELAKYIPNSNREGYTTDRMLQLMDFLGNPQNQLKIVHIAGTSGKTSTCYFTAALLGASGNKVGLSVSPHIDQINERVQINLSPIPEKEYCQLLTRFLGLVERSKLKPSYFEVLVAFAYWVFNKQQVDYAVIEVGLGGLLDGTNVVNREDKVCVITDIGLDHTSILGKTIPEIAAQKAGIINHGNTALVHPQSAEAMEVFRSTTTKQSGQLIEVSDKPVVIHSDIPSFQSRNFSLALATYNHIASRDSLDTLNNDQLTQALHVYIPARMEVIGVQGKTVILDGSHNQQKLEALIKSVKVKYPEQSVNLLVSFGENKIEYVKEALAELHKLGDRITLTKFKLGQDEPRKPIDPDLLASICSEVGFTHIQIKADPIQAFQDTLDDSSDILLVTGSFYLLSHIRPLVLTA